MKKIVPDPPTDQPSSYFLTTPALTREEAITRATGIMQRLTKAGDGYLKAETDEERIYTLDTMEILNDVLDGLIIHIKGLESAS